MESNLKKLTSFVLCISVLATSFECIAVSAENASEITIEKTIDSPVMTVNDTEVGIDENETAPIIENGRTLVPIRAIAEALGGDVEWSGEEEKITITREYTVIELFIDNVNASINGSDVVLDTAPIIINGRTMVPLRFVAEGLGASIEWYDDTKEIVITFANEDTAETEEKAPEAETETDEEDEAVKRVASDGAQMQTEDSSVPTRVLEEGTRINMYFGDTVIPGILNDSKTAKAFIELLPITINESKYSHDFCGAMDDFLPYDEEDNRYGWLNGDIAVGTDVPWFTILFADEDISEQYGNLVNIGVIDCELSAISELSGSYDVLIELAE